MAASKDGELGQYAEPALLILDSLVTGPKHGYALMADIETRTGRSLGPGTLYAALARLEARGLIQPLDSTDRRRPYELTRSGSRLLRNQLQQLSRFSETGLRRLEGRSR
jgi:DNA-binding PadR family transcriptional regulator